MAQTKDGASKMMQTIVRKYGLTDDGRSKMHTEAGALGGKAKVPKGFALMDKQKLVEASAKGGRISRRTKKDEK